MGINLLEAICNVIDADKSEVTQLSNSHNRMNSQGESLEAFVKDAFANAFDVEDEHAKLRIYQNAFSYLGNQNNPPDFMVQGGDAVEVKKTESSGDLSLNSSYPKTHLDSKSPMISKACREAENWTKKDFLYVVGRLSKIAGSIERLWFVYGDCYAAEAEVYEKPRRIIRESLAQSGLELEKTNELGRVNKVDPLGITNMRIRGMYLLQGPEKVFSRYLPERPSSNARLTAIMTEEKFLSMPSVSVARLRVYESQGLSITKVQLANPNNPASGVPGIVIDWLKS